MLLRLFSKSRFFIMSVQTADGVDCIYRRTKWCARAGSLLLVLLGILAPLSKARAVVLTPADMANIEAGMDMVYSQQSFGTAPIDIRLRELITIVDPILASIDNDTEFFDVLVNTAQDTSRPLVNMFFVDELFGPSGPIGQTLPGLNAFIVETAPAIDPVFGDYLNSHELGHSLALTHDLFPFSGMTVPTGNLMHPINPGTQVAGSQVQEIFNRPFFNSGVPLFQGNATSGFFIDIQPYQIVASEPAPVPLPAALPLFAGGLGLLGLLGWRRKRLAAA